MVITTNDPEGNTMAAVRRQWRKQGPVAALAAFVIAGVIVALGPAHASGSVAAPAAVPNVPIALGADVKGTGGQTPQQAIMAFEAETGRKLAFTRDFLQWDSSFPTAYETWLGQRGTMPLISTKSHRASGTVLWKDLAKALPGSTVYNQIKAWADKIKAFGYPVYYTFNHEPEAAASSTMGTPADYIAAWRNIWTVFQTEKATNAKFMWIMTAYAFQVKSTDRRYAWSWYPGDAYVDAIAADAYTEYNCRNSGGLWHSLEYQTADLVRFGTQHPTKSLWLAEWGVVEDKKVPGRKAQFITDAQALFKTPAYHQFAGISYFNQTRPGTPCDWHVETSPTAKAAYIALARDPFFGAAAS
jgi:hypothetical protein